MFKQTALSIVLLSVCVTGIICGCVYFENHAIDSIVVSTSNNKTVITCYRYLSMKNDAIELGYKRIPSVTVTKKENSLESRGWGIGFPYLFIDVGKLLRE
ncbi:hypothetical protein C0583_04120 [Candidatus Parcubacteria bacterium]|nr:MAG: hypothetical protein C0583_04120 [Candidatus Parcubacteria bacterium]